MRAAIPRSELDAFVSSLGVDPRDVESIDIDPDKVTVTQLRRDEDGHLHAAGNFVTTVTTEIAIEVNA